MAEKCIDDILMVDENTIKKAKINLLEKDKVIAEPAGAGSVGAVMENPSYFRGKNVAVIVSGGNLDEGLMRDLLCNHF